MMLQENASLSESTGPVTPEESGGPTRVLLAEDDRTYNLWCYAQPARRNGTLPAHLNWGVLYERRYAFEWLCGNENWDDVACDA